MIAKAQFATGVQSLALGVVGHVCRKHYRGPVRIRSCKKILCTVLGPEVLHLEEIAFPTPTPAAVTATMATGGQKKDATAAAEAKAKLAVAASFMSVNFDRLLGWKSGDSLYL